MRLVQTSTLQTTLLTDAVRRRLLTFVLLAVLVWYTVVVPAPAAFVRSATGGPPDAEERDADNAAPARAPSAVADAPAEDLDWPEFING